MSTMIVSVVALLPNARVTQTAPAVRARTSILCAVSNRDQATAATAKVDDALRILEDAGVAASLLQMVRDDLASSMSETSTGRVVPVAQVPESEASLAAVAGRTIMTSIFGESKAVRDAREQAAAAAAERDRMARERLAALESAAAAAQRELDDERASAAKAKAATNAGATEAAPPGATEAAPPGATEAAPRPTSMSAEAAAEYPASAKRVLWLEGRLAAVRDPKQRAEHERELQRILKDAVTAREREENARRDAQRRAKQQAAADLQAGLHAIDFGQAAGTAAARQGLRSAIEAAWAAGVEASDLRQAEVLEEQAVQLAAQEAARERVAAERAAALAAAERAAAERAAAQEAAARAAAERAAAAQDAAAREAQRMEAELTEAEMQLRRSVQLPWPQRKQLLRELQVKWHPDMQYGNAAIRERATALAAKANEAMRVARENAKLRGEA